MSSTNLLLFNTANAASYKASALEAAVAVGVKLCTGGHATGAQGAEARWPIPQPPCFNRH